MLAVPPPVAPDVRPGPSAVARPRSRMVVRLHWTDLAMPISLIVLLAVWEAYVDSGRIAAYLLPPPSGIARALANGLSKGLMDRSGYWFHMIGSPNATLRGALGGYLLGCTAGAVIGILVAEFKVLERVLLPYAVGLQSLPKVAIAPLMLIWFGFGMTSKLIIIALLTFFPLLINTYVGLSLVDRDYVLLMRSLRANRWQILTKVKLKSALPMIFAGLDMSTVYAVLGAIVAEFVGSDAGLGVMILQAQQTNASASIFAVLVILAIVGYAFHGLLQWLGRRLVFWTQTEDPLRVTS